MNKVMYHYFIQMSLFWHNEVYIVTAATYPLGAHCEPVKYTQTSYRMAAIMMVY